MGQYSLENELGRNKGSGNSDQHVEMMSYMSKPGHLEYQDTPNSSISIRLKYVPGVKISTFVHAGNNREDWQDLRGVGNHGCQGVLYGNGR